MDAIAVRGLRYSYPDGTQALRGVELRVAPGERVAILGPNGAGKTTLALHMNALIAAQEGELLLGDRPFADLKARDIRRAVGLVFQDPDDQLFLPTVIRDVEFGPTNFGLSDPGGRARKALQDVGMGEYSQRSPHHLSFGQRRRVAIATVLALEPDVLVLDEPTSNLDPASRRELADVLLLRGEAMLIVTHDLLFAWQMCPRSVVLLDGRVAHDGPTRELLTNPRLLEGLGLELPFGVKLD